MTTNERTAPALSVPRAAAMYIGALLGPSLLLLPGLAAAKAGPASILAWVGLLAVSALIATLFSRLGTRLRSSAGVAAYAAAGLGDRAGAVIGWCFVAGVVGGAPVVCLIGGNYLAELFGGGHTFSVLAAAAMLVLVLAIRLAGARTGTGVQLVLVGTLAAMVVLAVVGSAPAARTANWTPFAPHGWLALGGAASVLMLSFVGWEAVAPLTSRLANPRRQLPRVIVIAFAATSVVYLALAVSTVSVLGPRAGSSVPLAELLRTALGSAGPAVAAVGAVALTLAATNAYLSGAAEMAVRLWRARSPRPAAAPAPAKAGIGLPVAIAGAGIVLLGLAGVGVIDGSSLVSLPTVLFLTVYLGCTAAAARILTGPMRLVAVVACLGVAVLLAFSGGTLLVAVFVAAVAAVFGVPRRRHRTAPAADRFGVRPDTEVPEPAGRPAA